MSERPVNVHPAERYAAAGLAGLLLVQLFRQPSLLRLGVLGCLAYRALRGHCYGYEMLGISTCPVKRAA